MSEYPNVLTRRAHGNPNCTIETCPVSESVYGYYPSKPVNLLLAVLFGISLVVHGWQGIRWKSWTFLVALGVGTLLELIGSSNAPVA